MTVWLNQLLGDGTTEFVTYRLLSAPRRSIDSFVNGRFDLCHERLEERLEHFPSLVMVRKDIH
jgi:hypothetical protein